MQVLGQHTQGTPFPSLSVHGHGLRAWSHPLKPAFCPSAVGRAHSCCSPWDCPRRDRIDLGAESGSSSPQSRHGQAKIKAFDFQTKEKQPFYRTGILWLPANDAETGVPAHQGGQFSPFLVLGGGFGLKFGYQACSQLCTGSPLPSGKAATCSQSCSGSVHPGEPRDPSELAFPFPAFTSSLFLTSQEQKGPK